MPERRPPPASASNITRIGAVMGLRHLDHVNIRTVQPERLSRFYQEVLGLTLGYRPPFSFGGAWLYCGERAAIHLVEIEESQAQGAGRIEHFAFAAEGLAEFLAHLAAAEIPHRISIVPKDGTRQVNLHDPDGNHVEVAFGADEPLDFSSLE